MKRIAAVRFRFGTLRLLLALALCAGGIFLSALSLAAARAAGWSIVPSPNSSTQPNSLAAVDCTSASDCWAVGSHIQNAVQRTLIQHWNGTSWTIVPSPNTSAAQNNVLHSVACASPSECWAVGSYTKSDIASDVDRTLIQRWNGTSWSIVASPNEGTKANHLRDVTCASASACWAVGDFIITDSVLSEFTQTLIQRWNGTAWRIVDSANYTVPEGYPAGPGRYMDNDLESVTCASGSDCWAVGSVNRYHTVIQHWNGNSWSLVDSLNAGAEDYNLLQSVTCASSSQCWAVGSWYYLGGSAEEAAKNLVLRWNGSKWSLVSSPNASPSSSLNGVACTSASECWAVGAYRNSNDGTTRTLIEKWNGNGWAIIPSDDLAGKSQNQLSGVTCTSKSDCWAVGLSAGGQSAQTLIERYTGGGTPSPQTRTVTTLSDAGPGSLRAALNNFKPGDTIDFSVTGTIVLSESPLSVFPEDLTIRGPGADRLAISGNGVTRVLEIHRDAGVTISGLTIRDGLVEELSGSAQGGGIYNLGAVTLLDCAIIDNHAEAGASSGGRDRNSGGGIQNWGRVVIKRCLISGNSIRNGYGGGIMNQGSLEIFNSTIANNHVNNDSLFDPENPPSSGGGISTGVFSEKLIVGSCTIAKNSITVSGSAISARGGGIGLASNSPSADVVNRVSNSIIATNAVTGNVGPDIYGNFESDGFNLIGKGNDSLGFTNGVKHDQVGGSGNSPINPKLSALANNGGPTATMKLLAGSPALDQGRSATLYDQRGFSRHRDLPGIANAAAENSSDIGAFERGAAP